MRGERAERTVMRLTGKICYICSHPLDALPWTGGERYCDRCLSVRPTQHKVYMSFMLRGGWRCQFLEADLKTSLPLKLTFAGPDKVREIFEKFSDSEKLENIAAFDYAINLGRGGIWLTLTRDQYAQLKKGR